MERQEQRLKELAPAVKNMEQLAAQFSDDPEQILPEAGPLELGRAYREKKAKPLLAQIVKVLRSVYRAYVDLVDKFNRLKRHYDWVRGSNDWLAGQLQEAKTENKGLKGIAANYERVKRAFGAEEVEWAVEDAKRREAAEQVQRWRTKQKLNRGGR